MNQATSTGTERPVHPTLSAVARPGPWSRLAGAERLGSARHWLALASVVAAAVIATLAVPMVPPLQFAYPAPSLRVALETGVALIALLAAAIVVHGWRGDPRLDRLLIAAGLALLAVTSAILTAMLAVAPGSGPRSVIAITGTLVGSALLAAGAFAPARRAARRAPLAIAALAAGAVALTAVPVALLSARWRGAGARLRPLAPDAVLAAAELGRAPARGRRLLRRRGRRPHVAGEPARRRLRAQARPRRGAFRVGQGPPRAAACDRSRMGAPGRRVAAAVLHRAAVGGAAGGRGRRGRAGDRPRAAADRARPARRRGPGAGLHPPARRAAGGPAGRRGHRHRRRARARGLALDDRAARPPGRRAAGAHPRPARGRDRRSHGRGGDVLDLGLARCHGPR